MSSGDLWFVKLANGDVHHVSIDQLDAAFEAGHIDANTLVLPEGSTQWVRLGEAAGLDEAPPPAAPSPTPAPVTVPAHAASHRPAPVSYAAPAPVSYAPRAAVSYAPQAAASYAPRAPVSYAPPANSIRPVAMDLGSDFDLADVPFKKSGSKKGGWVVAVLTLALVGAGVGFAATNGGALSGLPLVAAAAAPAPAPAPAPPPPAVQADPVAATPATPAAPPPPVVQAPLAGTLPSMEASPLSPRFTEAQKEKLVQADKVREDKAKSRQSGHYSTRSSPSYKSSSSFSKGGNKFDPLNSDL